jgi:hypothetical protein
VRAFRGGVACVAGTEKAVTCARRHIIRAMRGFLVEDPPSAGRHDGLAPPPGARHFEFFCNRRALRGTHLLSGGTGPRVTRARSTRRAEVRRARRVASREDEAMWKKLLLASLFTAVGGTAALTAADLAMKPEPGRPGPGLPRHMTCAGVLRHSMVNTSGGKVKAWSLEEGKDNPILRLRTPELKKKAEKLLGKKVKVKMTTYELADTLGGHVVLEIDPAEGAEAFPAYGKPKLTFTRDGKDLVVSARITANNSSHVLWTHALVLGKDVHLSYYVFQNRDSLVRSQKEIEVKWRLVGRKKGEEAYHVEVEKSFLPSSAELKELLPQLQKLAEEGKKFKEGKGLKP